MRAQIVIFLNTLPNFQNDLAFQESAPVGNFYSAGEHGSSEFQGCINGGALTGQEAAEAIQAKLPSKSFLKPQL